MRGRYRRPSGAWPRANSPYLTELTCAMAPLAAFSPLLRPQMPTCFRQNFPEIALIFSRFYTRLPWPHVRVVNG